MLRASRNLLSTIYRNVNNLRSFASAGGKVRVTLCGAAGNTGQAAALMLKMSPLIDELILYDVANTNGMALELSHIDSNCMVHSSKSNIKEAVKNATIVAILASAPKTSPESCEMFKKNASMVYDIVTAAAQYCPKAYLAIGTVPVNSMVPLASEIMKRHRCYDKNRIFGINGVNVMRAQNIVAFHQGLLPEQVRVPIVGGISGYTIIPVLSQTSPEVKLTSDDVLKITEVIQSACLEPGKTATKTSMTAALAVTRLVTNILKGMKGEAVIENCYVHSNVYPAMDYMATEIELGPEGMVRNFGLPDMSEYEKCLLHCAVTMIREDIKLGEDYVGGKQNLKRLLQSIKCKLTPCN